MRRFRATMDTTDPGTPTYPSQLRDLEQALLALAKDRKKDAPKLGVALSGGGIRSATFALGVFQAWAKRKFLSEIDVISTVSGGGYFGAFFGRLLSRPYVLSIRDAELVLGREPDANEDVSPELNSAKEKVVDWLRENGRYMSPRGSGDTLLMGAAMFRNWLSIHVVLGLLAFAIFQLMQWPRIVAGRLPGSSALATVTRHLPGASTWLWWSPWMIPGLVAFGVLAMPLAMAYWLTSSDRSRWWPVAAVIGLIGAVSIAWPWFSKTSADAPSAWLALTTMSGDTSHVLLAALYLVAGWLVLALLFRVSAWIFVRVLARDLEATDAGQRQQFIEAKLRSLFSTNLRNLLIVSGALIALGVVDTLGQTIYALTTDGHLRDWVIGIGAAVVTIGAAARQLAVMLGGKTGGKRLKVPVALLTTVGAVLLVSTVTIGYDILAQGVRWQFRAPGSPSTLGAQDAGTVTITAPASQSLTIISTPGPAERPPNDATPIYWRWYVAWLGATCVLAFAFGRSFSFVNESSHQSIYSARLTRAYLGASNPERWSDANVPVINPMQGDDIGMSEYWQAPNRDGSLQTPAMFEKGAPLHIVNVTINETFGGRSQIQQQDRKGLGMALGPAGISVGAHHHLAFDRTAKVAPDSRPSTPAVIAPGPFQVFQLQTPRWSTSLWKRMMQPVRNLVTPDRWHTLFPDQQSFPGERLSIGRWIAISGAALSTGMGASTNLGLSLLLGLMNVRLGHWWDAGVDPSARTGTAQGRPLSDLFGTLFERAFPVQKFLVSELMARFPGIARRYWYLSDGGHFENMGGYELIRRRLPLVIIVDAEEDGAYTFEGFANLVRKARIDFDAEITVLSETQLKSAFGAGKRPKSFGSLDRLRPDCPKDADPDQACDPVTFSHAHVAVAKIEYADERDLKDRPTRWLFYVKTSLSGDEPADVIEYARRQPPFPQQSTADQFFDESQWESYRRLGEHVGDVLLDGLMMRGVDYWTSGLPRRRRRAVAGGT